MASVNLSLQTSAGNDYSLHMANATRMLGAKDPWVEIELRGEGFNGSSSPCLQPLSCFQSALLGRQTAALCQDGMLSFRKDGGFVCVTYSGMRSLSGTVDLAAFQSALSQLEAST